MQRRWSQEAYIETYHFAAQAHLGQLMPGSDLPYIVHVSFVSMEVIAALEVEAEGAIDGDLAVRCALLHDVIEDTRTPYEQVRSAFGEPVAQGVLALSKDAGLEKALQMPDSLQRIRQQPREVWMVKLADRISNLQAPPHYWTAERITRYRAEALEIHAALHSASPFLAQRLMAKIAAYGP